MSLQYTTATALSISATFLVNNGNRSSAAVTTSTDINVVEILVNISFNTQNISYTGNRLMTVCAYVSEDGTNYSGNSSTVDNVNGTNKALTAIGSPTNLIVLGYIHNIQTTGVVTISESFELISLLGFIPYKWGIVVVNDSNQQLGSTFSATYRERYYT